MNQATIDRIRKFSEECDWEQFHSPALAGKRPKDWYLSLPSSDKKIFSGGRI